MVQTPERASRLSHLVRHPKNDRLPTFYPDFCVAHERPELGHDERFPPTKRSAGYGFSKETIARMRRNGPRGAVSGRSDRAHLTARFDFLKTFAGDICKRIYSLFG